MSSVPPRDPLASTNPNSSALNQSHLVSRVPEPLGDGGSSGSLRHSKLPPQNVFPTYRPGESSRQLAQAALQYGSEHSTEGFGEGEITQDYNSGSLAFDPSLSSSFSLGNESIEGQAQTHDDELDAEGSVQDEERLDFRPPALPPGKRRGPSLSPTSQQDAKKPCSESSRAREIASQLEAPLPPANTILAANQHAAAAAGPSSQGPGVYHGISLSPGGFQPQSQQQLLQANLAHCFAVIGELKERNGLLEVQLCNRNEECRRLVAIIRKVNDYADEAKVCMKKDGDAINRMRDVLIITKNKMEGWLNTLEPLVVRESPATGSGEGSTSTGGDMPVTRVVTDVANIIHNFERTLIDIHRRPVHEIYGQTPPPPPVPPLSHPALGRLNIN
ncbi:hypothetical protein TWF569_004409 [Orbilia oligospora]|uniref:Uncharacterized protein n=1 Tax=Orbilia oligospora TaxID=2813651 RepID=A0A7C8J9B8_ORBOL|nr:hypothetical protein TWF706_009892 [Orbilia oligospora]KAF3094999.1 hypothetical protein TWF102_007398 [Orbilia oligospora]KAF3098070.1 hypothetical protein TWF103_009170 [Orbilia oligospora]KAF3139416.1 hypothetical protein TWF594_006706 [Orbilia oligospora]KAF3145150.1 hypothetical protein TWF703_007734 [Orbilia oligospora]